MGSIQRNGYLRCCPKAERILTGYLNSYLDSERNEIKLKLQLVKKQPLVISQQRAMFAHFLVWTISYFCLFRHEHAVVLFFLALI